MVEILQKSVMERHSGTEYGSEHYLLVEYLALGLRQWCLALFGAVAHCARYLIGHDLAYAFEITAETEHVALNVDVAQFGHILIDERRTLCEVYYLHSLYL